jgi:hypothetical protein
MGYITHTSPRLATNTFWNGGFSIPDAAFVERWRRSATSLDVALGTRTSIAWYADPVRSGSKVGGIRFRYGEGEGLGRAPTVQMVRSLALCPFIE